MTKASAPANLRCEYHLNPLGIDVARPRLSWELRDPRRGARQTAYQVLVAGSATTLSQDHGDRWDSGQVRSDRSVQVEYDGKPLPSGQRAFWKVRAWDAQGKPSPWSRPAWWEMGLLNRQEWVGHWIGSPLVGGPQTTSPCPFLRQTFTIRQPVKSARLYVTALGVYEFHLNGQRVGDEVFRPGWTDYHQRVQYDVYDVTALLRIGDNAAGAILGDGWYCGHVAAGDRQNYGDRPRLLAQIAVELTDGRRAIITTDASWRTSSGPLLEADLIMGEAYDARLELPGWSDADYNDAEWTKARRFADPGLAIVVRRGPPVRRIQELKPRAPVSAPGLPWGYRGWIFDLRQNMVGRVRLKVRGPRGTTIRLRFGEMLDAQGRLYTANLRSARATDSYTLKGNGTETWEPRFTFHGFRYVELSTGPDSKLELLPGAVTGVVLHSDMPPTGEFACADPLLNQLQRNIQWGQKGNFLEVPTDCPQRDERLGWTGDAQVFCRTAAFNMDVAAFFTKWQQDLADAQAANGAVPAVAPYSSLVPTDGGPAWADAAVICPWTIHLCYGDTRLLAEHYESLTRFIAFLVTTSRDCIRSGGFGDWLALDGSGKTDGGTPKDLIGTAFLAHSARLVGRMARVLGKTGDAARYERLFGKVRAAFNRRFVTRDGLILGQTQTASVLALHFDLLPDALRPQIAQALVRDIESRGMHLSTGFVGTSYLPQVLTAVDRTDIAYALLHQKTWPSWLYAVTQGATTIWERWDGWTHDKGFQDPGMNSFNHYAYGAIGEWLYRTVAGIDVDPEKPGYKHILIRPRPGGGLAHARAKLHTMYGLVESRWRIQKKTLRLNVTIPPNTTATVHLPGRRPIKIRAGRYAFSAPMPG